MASCLTVTASAGQASVLSSPAGSTTGQLAQRASAQPAQSGDQQTQKPKPAPAKPEDDSQSLPTSVEKVRDGLARDPVIRLDTQPIFRIGITERRPSYYDMDAQFLFPAAPRVSTTRWHDEFLAMTTPDEVRAFSPLNSGTETLQLAATSLLFAGVTKLVQSGFAKWRDGRSEGKAREAREEVDAAIAAWEAANPPAAPKRE